MKTIKTWAMGVLVTYIIVHIVCIIATKVTGGGQGLIVDVAEIVASILIFKTIKKDFEP